MNVRLRFISKRWDFSFTIVPGGHNHVVKKQFPSQPSSAIRNRRQKKKEKSQQFFWVIKHFILRNCSAKNSILSKSCHTHLFIINGQNDDGLRDNNSRAHWRQLSNAGIDETAADLTGGLRVESGSRCTALHVRNDHVVGGQFETAVESPDAAVLRPTTHHASESPTTVLKWYDIGKYCHDFIHYNERYLCRYFVPWRILFCVSFRKVETRKTWAIETTGINTIPALEGQPARVIRIAWAWRSARGKRPIASSRGSDAALSDRDQRRIWGVRC